jgi:hypothetical protein
MRAVQLAAVETEASVPALAERPIPRPPTETERIAPDKAYALLEALQQRNGNTLPGYVGGKVFHNRSVGCRADAIENTTST